MTFVTIYNLIELNNNFLALKKITSVHNNNAQTFPHFLSLNFHKDWKYNLTFVENLMGKLIDPQHEKNTKNPQAKYNKIISIILLCYAQINLRNLNFVQWSILLSLSVTLCTQCHWFLFCKNYICIHLPFRIFSFPKVQ